MVLVERIGELEEELLKTLFQLLPELPKLLEKLFLLLMENLLECLSVFLLPMYLLSILHADLTNQHLTKKFVQQLNKLLKVLTRESLVTLTTKLFLLTSLVTQDLLFLMPKLEFL